MFERKKYKQFAITQLSGRWLIPVLITLFVTIISILFQIPSILTLYRSGYFSAILEGNYTEVLNALKEVSNSTSNLSSMIELFVSSILEIATINVYLKMSRSPEPVPFSSFFEGFNYWARGILTNIYQIIWLTIWSLPGFILFFVALNLNQSFLILIAIPLALVPMIIKSFSYSQMMFIVTEYQEVSIPKALKISSLITEGHKWDIFVMYLSFMGWNLLCFFTLEIGNLWLTPYKNMTYTNAYHAMLKEAIESNIIKPEELAK